MKLSSVIVIGVQDNQLCLPIKARSILILPMVCLGLLVIFEYIYVFSQLADYRCSSIVLLLLCLSQEP